MAKSAKPTMIGEYLERQTELTQQYGDKAVVLFECGGFYEVYEERMCTCASPEPPTRREPRLCANCRCVVAGQTPRGKASILEHIWNTAKPSKSTRWWMVGFPSDNAAAFQRHIGVLVKNGWTAAVYNQHDASDVNRLATKQEKVRTLTKIYSKGTYGRNDDDTMASSAKDIMTMCIYVRRSDDLLLMTTPASPSDANADGDTSMYEIGVATLNVDTHEVACGEVYTTEDDRTLPFSYLRTLLCELTPREYLIIGDGVKPADLSALFRRHAISIPMCDTVCRRPSKRLQPVRNREAVFSQVFRCAAHTGVPVMQRIGVARREIASITLAELVVFVEHHDASLVCNLPIPQRLMDTKHLILHATTLRQLDVLPKHTDESNDNTNRTSLVQVVDHCTTPYGRALLRSRICRPSTDTCEIERRLDLATALLSDYEGIVDPLRQMASLQRIVARIRAKRLSYPQIGVLARLVDHATRLFNNHMKKRIATCPVMSQCVGTIFGAKDRGLLTELHAMLRTVFDMGRVGSVSASNVERVSCYNTGHCAQIDKLVRETGDILAYMRSIGNLLRDRLPPVRVGNRRKPVSIQESDMRLNTTDGSDRRRYTYELTGRATKSLKAAVSSSSSTRAVRAAVPCSVSGILGDTRDEGSSNCSRSLCDPIRDRSTNRSNTFVTFEWQVPLVDALIEKHASLVVAAKEALDKFQETLNMLYLPMLERLLVFVSELDVATSTASVATSYFVHAPEVRVNQHVRDGGPTHEHNRPSPRDHRAARRCDGVHPE